MGRVASAGVVLTLPFLLGACSSLSFLFGDDDLEPQRIEIQSVREEDPDTPNLASVPEQPPLPSPSAQRSGIIEGLSADRENARYTEEPLTPQIVAVPPATPPEPAYPPPPAAQTLRTQVAESAAVSSGVPPPPDIGVLQDSDQPLAPPPPALPAAPASAPATAAPTALPPPESTVAGSSAAPSPAVPAAPPQASPAESSSASGNGLLYQPPTGLLQQQAFQQQVLQQQQLQQLALNRQAFEQQARLEAIQQQQLREQVIQQQAAQWKYPALHHPQIPAVAPANGPGQIPGQVPALATPAFAQSFATPAPAALAGQQTVYSPASSFGLATQSVPGQLIGLIYFQHGSAHLSGRDMQILQQVAALQRYQSRGLRIVGHSSARTGFVDQQRHEAANRTMSLRRANVVASELVRLGADQSRIRIDGLGAAQPIYHEFMPTGEAGNRRVEIFLE